MSSSVLRWKDESSCSGIIQFTSKTGKAGPERLGDFPEDAQESLDKLASPDFLQNSFFLWSIWPVHFLMKRTTVDKGQEAFELKSTAARASLFSQEGTLNSLHLQLLSHPGLTPIIESIEKARETTKLKPLEYCDRVMQRRSFKEVPRLRTESSDKKKKKKKKKI